MTVSWSIFRLFCSTLDTEECFIEPIDQRTYKDQKETIIQRIGKLSETVNLTRNAQKWQFLVSVSRQCFNSNRRLKRAINAINDQYMTNTLTNTPKGRIRANNNTPMNAENFQGQEGLK